MVKQCAAVLLLLPALAAAQPATQEFPTQIGRVNDFAEILDPAVEAELDRKLEELEKKTTSEIVVVTVSSLGPWSVEAYANKLFNTWGIGQAKPDNGVLVLVSWIDHKMRVEVGYGLEGVLPDGLAGEVIRDQFTPKFSKSDYSGGVRDGVMRLIEIVEKHEVLPPEEIERLNSGRTKMTPTIMLVVVLFFGVFVSIGFGLLGIGIRAKAGFPLVMGGMFGAMPLAMSFVALKTVSYFTLFPLAAVAGWIGFRMAGKKEVRDSWRGENASSSGWTMGDNDSDSSSSSSSSSDSGGGSSGGGGASGSW